MALDYGLELYTHLEASDNYPYSVQFVQYVTYRRVVIDCMAQSICPAANIYSIHQETQDLCTAQMSITFMSETLP
jgi:hypothetical protein